MSINKRNILNPDNYMENPPGKKIRSNENTYDSSDIVAFGICIYMFLVAANAGRVKVANDLMNKMKRFATLFHQNASNGGSTERSGGLPSSSNDRATTLPKALLNSLGTVYIVPYPPGCSRKALLSLLTFPPDLEFLLSLGIPTGLATACVEKWTVKKMPWLDSKNLSWCSLTHLHENCGGSDEGTHKNAGEKMTSNSTSKTRKKNPNTNANVIANSLSLGDYLFMYDDLNVHDNARCQNKKRISSFACVINGQNSIKHSLKNDSDFEKIDFYGYQVLNQVLMDGNFTENNTLGMWRKIRLHVNDKRNVGQIFDQARRTFHNIPNHVTQILRDTKTDAFMKKSHLLEEVKYESKIIADLVMHLTDLEIWYDLVFSINFHNRGPDECEMLRKRKDLDCTIKRTKLIKNMLLATGIITGTCGIFCWWNKRK